MRFEIKQSREDEMPLPLAIEFTDLIRNILTPNIPKVYQNLNLKCKTVRQSIEQFKNDLNTFHAASKFANTEVQNKCLHSMDEQVINGRHKMNEIQQIMQKVSHELEDFGESIEPNIENYVKKLDQIINLMDKVYLDYKMVQNSNIENTPNLRVNSK